MIVFLAIRYNQARKLIFVMLSGHGQQLEVKDEQGLWTESSFFCPFDAIANTPDSLVSLSGMIDQQLSPNVGRNLILVDACRDSPSESSRGIQGRVIALQEDTAILFSCRAGQRSFENSELGHGLFTYALLQALRGGAARDGKIVWSQVVSYVDWAMASEKICSYMPAPQVPISAGGVPFAVIGQGNWNEPRQDSPLPPRQPKLDSLLMNSIGMKLIKVNVGEFVMGSPASEQGHEPDEHQHPIQIDNPFWMSVYEITQSEYDAVMGQSPSYFRQSGIGAEFLLSPLTDQLPVEQVSWHQAVDFCRKLNDCNRCQHSSVTRNCLLTNWEN